MLGTIHSHALSILNPSMSLQLVWRCLLWIVSLNGPGLSASYSHPPGEMATERRWEENRMISENTVDCEVS